MFDVLPMFIPVIVICAVAKYWFGNEITWQESAVQLVVSCLIVFGTYQAGLSSRMRDYQFLNGVVTDKQREQVSCDHSYQCNCTSDGKGNRTCQTCYEHAWDYDWRVFTNAGNKDESTFLIDRIDRQGSWTPPRWDAVRISEPVALRRPFDNYVLAADHSLLHLRTSRKMPAYPKAYDYIRADRVIADGVAMPDLQQWNADLTDRLTRLGPARQANVILVVTNALSPQYGDDLRKSWLNGKKNDIVVVIGAPRYPAIQWAQVFSWSKTDMVNVALRNDLAQLGQVRRTAVLDLIDHQVMTNYQRRPMAEYEYLRREIEPTPTFLIAGWLLAVLAPIGLTYLFATYEVFGTSRRFNASRFGRFR